MYDLSRHTSINNTVENVLQCCYTVLLCIFLKLLCQLYKEVIHTEYEEVLLQGSRIASITYLYLNGPHMSS